ncbi:MAG: hypothetical protein FJY99_04745 [Candidatus Sericytochromatia bacterium]|nr:hypothetical protein [Candidatus Tanganyikabacteria bacterium]
MSEPLAADNGGVPAPAPSGMDAAAALSDLLVRRTVRLEDGRSLTYYDFVAATDAAAPSEG